MKKYSESGKNVRKKCPLWLKIFNGCFLLPILAAPLVFYASIFLFDNPSNLPLAYTLFFAINAYSLLLIGAVLFSIRLYRKHGRALLALTPHLVVVLILLLLIAVI